MIHVGTSIAGLEALSDYRLGKLAPCIKVDGVPLSKRDTNIRRRIIVRHYVKVLCHTSLVCSPPYPIHDHKYDINTNAVMYNST